MHQGERGKGTIAVDRLGTSGELGENLTSHPSIQLHMEPIKS